MQFTPKTPDEQVNYARENPLREALLLTAVVAGIVLAILFGGAWAVEELAVRTPPAWEARLFGFMAKSFRGTNDDPRSQRVADLLTSLDPDAAQKVRLLVLDDEQLNAFAAPGGVILVTTGLLDAVESENELAFVLGHELGHVRHRDHLRSMGRGLGASLSLTFLSAMIGTDVSALGWAQELSNLRFSRQQERRADDWGLELTAKRYGHVAGATAFFERLPRAESAVARGAEKFLSSHPVSENRIERLGKLASERGWSVEGGLTSFPRKT